MSAFETMREVCAKKGQLALFEKSLADHLATGVVISMPEVFGMAKAVKLEDGRIAWLVDSAAGKLQQLIQYFPRFLPWIAFCRVKDNTGRLRVYPMEKFIRRARA